jgi:hypothetical protein
MAQFPAMVFGTGFGLGVLLFAVGLRTRPRADTGVGGGFVALVRGRGPVRVASALVAAALVLLATGWPVGGFLAALSVWALPGMLMGAERARRVRLQRLEGIASWTESLVATMSGAAGLEQTIIATAPGAAVAVRSPVVGLAEALRRGVRLPDALREFAADLADPVGDTVAASLLLASTQGGGRLTEPLSLLAAAARDEVAAQRRVEKGRAKAATDARMIIMTTAAMAVGLVVFNRGYLHPYDSPAGQVVLAVVGGMFAVGFRWLHRLGRQRQPSRVLDLGAGSPPPRGSGAPAGVGSR